MISQEDSADESNFEIIVEGRVTDNGKTAAITDPNATRLADYANAINQQAGDVVTAAVENGRFVIVAKRQGVSLTFSDPNLILLCLGILENTGTLIFNGMRINVVFGTYRVSGQQNGIWQYPKKTKSDVPGYTFVFLGLVCYDLSNLVQRG